MRATFSSQIAVALHAALFLFPVARHALAQSDPRQFAAAAEPAARAASTLLPDAPSIVAFSSSADDSAIAQDGQETQEQPARPPQPGQPSKSVKPKSIEERIFGLGEGDAERASHMASTTEKYILPGQRAPTLTEGDKIEFGFIHGVSAFGVMGWFVSSGYSHIINTTPNYGTDSGAYGERLGAAALRGYSTEVLKDSVAANIFHQDPRYYKMGPRHNVVVRTAYAVTRVLVTRDDDGRFAPNYSLLGGTAVSAALTNAYYPNVNRGFGQTAKTFGNSVYGAAFSYFAAEFISGAVQSIHLKADSR